MRDVIVHDYFKINTKFVWKTITEDLEALKEKVNQLSDNDFLFRKPSMRFGVGANGSGWALQDDFGLKAAMLGVFMYSDPSG